MMMMGGEDAWARDAGRATRARGVLNDIYIDWYIAHRVRACATTTTTTTTPRGG